LFSLAVLIGSGFRRLIDLPADFGMSTTGHVVRGLKIGR
jgi:hypothetical protein